MNKKAYYVLIAAVLWIAFLVFSHLQRDESKDAETTTESSTSTRGQARKDEIPKILTNTLGMRFVLIPAGTFMMGSPSDEPGRYDRETQHQVRLTRGFYMQTTEVTQGQWEKVMKANPSFFKDCGEDCPVEQVSWNDAQRFLWKLNQMERLYTYSLPTEAEWEYACRAGTTTRFNWGDEADCYKANYGVAFIRNECRGINPGKTMKVASFPPNAWGLYDMHGNVGEWCMDRFDNYYFDQATDPRGGYASVDRVYRGGSWNVDARYCRSANRDADQPIVRFSELGFRLVRAMSRYGMRNGRIRAVPPYPYDP